VADGDFDLFGLFGGEVVEGNGGLKHQQHIEAVSADVLDHAGDLLVLDDRLMDSLAQLLNEFAQTGCHIYLQWPRVAARISILTSAAARSKRELAKACQRRLATTAATIISE